MKPPRPGKIDNTSAAFQAKVALRWAVVDALALDRPARVLDAYAGHGRLWRHVARSGGPLEVMAIDAKPEAKRVLRADNRRVLGALDLSHFDVIDLDAYGIPADQCALIAGAGYAGPVVWTAITVGLGTLPRVVIESEGIPWSWTENGTRTVVAGCHDADDLCSRWCGYLGRLGWTSHVVLNPTWSFGQGGKLYGCSTPPAGCNRASILERWHRLDAARTMSTVTSTDGV